MMPGWLWLAVALLLIGAELATGTFYLLAVAVACFAGSAVAWAGGAVSTQLVVAGLVGVGGSVVAYFYQAQNRRAAQESTLKLDVGQKVTVIAWNADKTARVEYSGTQWDAVLADPETPRGTEMKILEARGNTLVLGAWDR